MLPIFNGSGLGLPGSGVTPPEAVSYPISPTGSNFGGEPCRGDNRDDDAIGGGGEPRVPCLLNLWNGGLTFPSSSGDMSSLSDLGCGDLPLWLVLVELPELEGGVLTFGAGADGYSPSLSDVVPGTIWSCETSDDTDLCLGVIDRLFSTADGFL